MTNTETRSTSQRDWVAKVNLDSLSKKNAKEKQIRFDNSIKVYIKNLPLENESSFNVLLEHLSSCGTVQHKHFFVKELARQKLQLGLAVFTSEEEAVKATNLTGTVIGGKHIIVSRYRQYAQPNSKTIFVSNLAVETNEEDLWVLFSSSGSIKFIHIDRPLNACSLNAEVHFKSVKGVQKAMELNGELLSGNAIIVRGSSDSEPLPHNQPSREFPVFVAGLPHDVQKEDLINFFDGCGPIKRIKIKSFQEEGEGQAVVFFMDAESAENAIACNGNEFSGYVLSVTQRKEGMLQYDFLNPVYVAGISRDTKDVDIFLKFQDCGLIHDIKFVQSKRGTLKKCVIEFKDFGGQEKALAEADLELNGEVLSIGKTRDVWSHVRSTEKTRKKRKMHGNRAELQAAEEEAHTSISENDKEKKKRKKVKKMESE